jgi:hypothetical protein
MIIEIELAALLVLQAWPLVRSRRSEPVAPIEPLPVAAPAPLPAPVATPARVAPPRVGLAEVLTKHRGEWGHYGWVRAHSPAWQHAHDTPGFALRSEDGQIVEGKQKP